MFIETTAEKKQKYRKIAIYIGIAGFVLGLIPGLYSWKIGIIIFVFSLVASGFMTVVVAEIEPDPTEPGVIPPQASNADEEQAPAEPESERNGDN